MHLANRLLPSELNKLAWRLVGYDLTPRWLNAAWFAERGVDMGTPSVLSGLVRDRLRKELLESLTETSLPHLLRYEDRNSMAHSLESRVPFLTPALARFVLSLPEGYIIDSGGTTKAVFRSAMRGLVPDAILDRKDKIGFATPELEWLRNMRPWVEEYLKGELLASVPVFRIDAVLKEWREVVEGKRRFDFRVWRWINLVAWTKLFGVEYV